jgi:hypothetical protein
LFEGWDIKGWDISGHDLDSESPVISKEKKRKEINGKRKGKK